MPVKVGFENLSLLQGYNKSAPLVGGDIFNDGDFEEWNNLVSWSSSQEGLGIGPLQSTDVHGGALAVELRGGGASSSGLSNLSMVEQTIAPLVAGDSYTMKLWMKGDASRLRVIYLSGLGNVWNFTGGAAGTWTPFGGAPTSDQIHTVIGTAAYAQYSVPAVTIDASNDIIVILLTEDVLVLDDVELLKDGIGPDIITDGGFENWAVGTEDPYWKDDSGAGGAGVGPDNVIFYSGAYSMRMTPAAGSPAVFYQCRSGMNPGSFYRLQFYATNVAAAGDVHVTIQDWDPDNLLTQQYWNFVTEVWDTVAAGAPANAQQTQTYVLGAVWSLNHDKFTAPAIGAVKVRFYSDNVLGNIVNVDLASLRLVINVPDNVILFDHLNGTNAADLASGDYVFRYRSEFGDDYLSLDYAGAYTTDYPYFNFQYKNMILGGCYFTAFSANYGEQDISYQATKASANNLVLTQDVNYITGNTQINRISAGISPAHSCVKYLIFDQALTVKHNQASGGGYYKIYLAGSADFVTNAGSTLTLLWDTTHQTWQEIARKVA